MQELKEVFIYNETYPLPKDVYDTYKSKVQGCSGNPMCLNNVKSDVESFISKWGRKSGIKLEDGDESGFMILKEDQNFSGDQAPIVVKKNSNLKTLGNIAMIIFLIMAIKNKSLLFGGVAFTLAFFLHRDKLGFSAK